LHVARLGESRQKAEKRDMAGTIYKVSAVGRKAVESKDASIPSDYRTILWVLEFQGSDQLNPLMRMFPEQLLSDCLAEMKELGLVEQVATPRVGSGDSTVVAAPPQEIISLANEELVTARDSLSRHGAYLAEARLKGRRRIEKAPSEITILIVEDDPDQLALADLRVSMAGYVVRVADSQSAMLRSIAEQGTPDLALLDVTLPDGNGFDILARMRSLPSFTSLPIVMLTAKTGPNDIVKGIMLGADGYVTKPYSKDILASVIRHILQVN
jgi:CheY-like chemotaxis protein